MAGQTQNQKIKTIMEKEVLSVSWHKDDYVDRLYIGAWGNRWLLYGAFTLLDKIAKTYNLNDVSAFEEKPSDYYWKKPMPQDRRIAASLVRTHVPSIYKQRLYVDFYTRTPFMTIWLSDWFLVNEIRMNMREYRVYAKHNVYGHEYRINSTWDSWDHPQLSAAILMKAREMIKFAMRILFTMRSNAEKIGDYTVVPYGVELIY